MSAESERASDLRRQSRQFPKAPPAPGDVLAVRSTGFASRMIRLDAAMHDEPDLDNHIAVVHHTDSHGTVWAIEGRPGGVGWRDAAAYLASPWTMANVRQPRTDEQRAAVCKIVESMLGTPYDWEAIVADGAGAFGLGDVWSPTWPAGGSATVPGHVVCSSLAAYAYQKAGIPCPVAAGTGTDPAREITPGDWEQFIVINRFD